MLLKDRVTFFTPRPSAADPYEMVYERYDLCGGMVFEKQAVGADFREEGKCVIYCFPTRSKPVGRGGKGAFPELHPGDLCVVGPCRRNFNPAAEDTAGCRRIVSVEKRSVGTEKVHHIVIEAV